MKKIVISTFCLTFLIALFVGCSSNKGDGPEQAASNFLHSLQTQKYTSAGTYYSENIDNMAHFRNQIEEISPTVATKLFDKMADFSYDIHEVTIDSNHPEQATVTATITAYDLGKSFESTVLEYIKTDLEMTFDGEKKEDIIKKAEEAVLKDIEASQKTFTTDVTISLTKDHDVWKLDKLSDNPVLLNALSGNIIDTIEMISETLNSK